MHKSKDLIYIDKKSCVTSYSAKGCFSSLRKELTWIPTLVTLRTMPTPLVSNSLEISDQASSFESSSSKITLCLTFDAINIINKLVWKSTEFPEILISSCKNI